MLRIILAFFVLLSLEQTQQDPLEPVLAPVLSLPKNLNQNSENNQAFSNNCKSKIDLGKKSMLSAKQKEARDFYFRLGFDNYYTDNYSKAEKYFKKGLEIATKACNEDNLREAAFIYKNLGKIYEKQKNYSQAINQYKQELNIYIGFFQDTHPITAITCSTIGTMYYNQRNYEKAEKYYYQAVYIFKKTLGEENPATISAIDDLRKIYIEKMRLHQFHPSFEEVSIIIVVSGVSMLIFCFYLAKMGILVNPNF